MSDRNTTAVSVPKPSTPARIAETLILGAIGAIIFWIIATTEHTNGLMLDLKNQSPEIVRASLICGGVALVGYLLSITLAAFGRSVKATILMTITLVGYGIALNGSGHFSAIRRAERETAKAEFEAVLLDPQITLNIGPIKLTGVDMWVNGVNLGKTPVVMPLSELLDKIPDWVEPPVDQVSDEARAYAKANNHQGTGFTFDKRWCPFSLPKSHFFQPQKLRPDLREKLQLRKRSCYARIVFDGHDGISSGGSRGNGGGKEYDIMIRFQLPHYEAVIERLLDQARLADYDVTAPWFEAFEAFGLDGWNTFRKAIAEEPKMERVLSAWAKWKYGTRRLHSSREALPLLQLIAEQADEENNYDTSGLAGHAVTQLAPHINTKDLADWSLKLIRRTSHEGFRDWQNHLARNTQTWIVSRNNVPRWSTVSGVVRTDSNGRSEGRLSPSDLVFAHAMVVNLQHADPGSPHSIKIRDQLAQCLLHRYTESSAATALQLAAKLGSPMMEKYILGKTARMQWDDMGEYYRRRTPNLGGVDVNFWWYLAAHLDSPEGKSFRHNHMEQIMEMADAIMQSYPDHYEVAPRLGFMFMKSGSKKTPPEHQSLARQYWPRFLATFSVNHFHNATATKAAYLVAAEPEFSASEYVDVFADAPDVHDATESFKVLDALPLTKRTEVLDAMRTMKDWEERKQPEWLTKSNGFFFRNLNRVRYELIDDQAAADYFLTGLQNGEQRFHFGKPFEEWLTEHVAERPVLLRALAQAEEADIRMLGIRAIGEHPTPANRESLKTLDDNGDATIKQEIAAIRQRWAKLIASTPK